MSLGSFHTGASAIPVEVGLRVRPGAGMDEDEGSRDQRESGWEDVGRPAFVGDRPPGEIDGPVAGILDREVLVVQVRRIVPRRHQSEKAT